MTRVLGLAWGERELSHADAAAERLATAPGVDGVVTTHVVAADGVRCYALAVAVADDADVADPRWREQPGATVVPADGEDPPRGDPRWVEAARAAADDRAAGRGRAVVFPGCDRLRGTVSVGHAREAGGVGTVRLLGSPGELDDATVLVTRDFVRPVLEDATLVLSVTPRGDGSVEPFERPAPHQCCGDHPEVMR